MPTFSYQVDYSAQVVNTPRVKSMRFGDGYEQRLADGINTQPAVWNLTFANRSNADTSAIHTFLSARGGVESFDWTPPDSTAAIKVLCRDWTKTMNRYNLNTITATFEQVFE
jgi:phage-related protein